MKKYMIILTAVCVGLLVAGPALAAGIDNSSHDGTFNNAFSGLVNDGGKCSACHIPHNASASGRLWPPGLGTISNARGTVATLCAYCHQALGGASGPGDAESDAFVYGTNSHGRLMSVLDNGNTTPYGQVQPGATLPYANDTNPDLIIECTSCHNVHSNDAGRPFLRADIDIICAACHGDRLFQESTTPTEGSAAITAGDISRWGDSWTGGLDGSQPGNPGSHPVGTDITGDNYGGASPITIPGQFELAYGTTSEWDLGGHLSNGQAQGTGGVVCVTCHAVHGAQEDPGSVTVNMTAKVPNLNFLIVGQNAQGFGAGARQGATGNGSRNYLCEACHTGAAVDGAYGTVDSAVLSTTESGAWAPENPNPGNQAFGHPVDGMDPLTGTAWVSSFPANWPSGGTGINTSGTNADPLPICESCHAPHALADGNGASAGRPDLEGYVDAAADTEYILRGTAGGVCADCHAAGAGVAHHPVGDEFQADQVSYLVGVSATSGTETSTCGTCHSQSGGGAAHNWTANPSSGGGFALDPNWVPYDNGRSQPDPQFATSLGKTCIDCHNYLQTGTTFHASPTNADRLSAGAGTDWANYQVLGDGSHFLGVFTNQRTTWPALGQRFGFNAFAESWNATNINSNITAGGGFSRFASVGGDYMLTCESCHELEPDLNAGAGEQLLLAAYDEGDTANTHSWFCEACHVPSGTHPLWNDSVGRTATTLNTDTGKDWLKVPGSGSAPLINDGNPTMGNNIVACDSCHQPHDAPTGSLTYILDADNANVAVGQSTDSSGAPAPFTNLLPTRNTGGAGWDYKNFCAACHPYN